MSGNDLAKIAKAGFLVIRFYDDTKQIKALMPAKSSNLPGEKPRNNAWSWQLLSGPYQSKAAMQRKINELLCNSNVVLGN